MRRIVNRTVDAIRGNAIVLRNAVFLAMGSGSTAVLGFAYWWVAARGFTPASVGTQSALISTMTFIGMLGEAGFGTTLLGEVLGRGDKGPAMIAAAVLAGSGVTLLLALGAGAVLWHFGWMTPVVAALFVCGSTFSGATLVLDGAFVGLLHGKWLFYRSLAFSAAKVAVLAGIALLTRDQAAIMLSWVAALLLSLLMICWSAGMRGVLILARPNFRLFRGRLSVVIDHHLLNLAAAAPALMLPLVVGLCLGPAVNGAFYAGWMVLTIALLVPGSLTTVMFTVGSHDPARLPQRVRFSLALSAAFALLVGVFLALASDRVLAVFNPAYPALAGRAVQVLGWGLIGGTLKLHYMLLTRISGTMMRGAGWMVLGACLELGFAAIGGELGGVRWLALGWIAATALEALFVLPCVLRAAGYPAGGSFPALLRRSVQYVRLIPAKLIVVALVAWTACAGSASAAADGFVRAEGAHFVLDGKEFYVTGVNDHYLPWASDAEIIRVLDAASAMGANVIRTFLGTAIGSPDGKTVPTIWRFHNDAADSNDLNVHGNYMLSWDPAAHRMVINPRAMRQTDFLLAQAAKRHLKVLLTFVDFWSYIGGAQQMRAWYGSDDKNRFFFTDPRTVADYEAWIRFVIQRVNPLTGIAYRDDPTIFAWELMNESQAPAALQGSWSAMMSAKVKSLDPHHMVASGDAGPNLADFTIATIDFVTWHGYPKYRGITPAAFNALIGNECRLAAQYRKPVLLEEFGYARSNEDPDQAEAYRMWTHTMRADQACAGWLVWKLVARQDDGHYPPDAYDQFDIHDDGGATWQVLSAAAHEGRGDADAK